MSNIDMLNYTQMSECTPGIYTGLKIFEYKIMQGLDAIYNQRFLIKFYDNHQL